MICGGLKCVKCVKLECVEYVEVEWRCEVCGGGVDV